MPEGVQQFDGTLRGVRLCVVDGSGTTRKVAQLKWSNADASLYVTPYCPPGGMAYAGRFTIPRGEPSYTFDFTGQAEAQDSMPKLSLHESGLTKTELSGQKSKFVEGQPLFSETGGHVATVKTFNPNSLPSITDLRTRKGVPNVVAVSDESFTNTSTRFPLIVHTDRAKAMTHKFVITFRRPTIGEPLYVAFNAHGENEPHNDGEGVVAFGGWGPGIAPGEISDIAFAVTTGMRSGQPD